MKRLIRLNRRTGQPFDVIAFTEGEVRRLIDEAHANSAALAKLGETAFVVRALDQLDEYRSIASDQWDRLSALLIEAGIDVYGETAIPLAWNRDAENRALLRVFDEMAEAAAHEARLQASLDEEQRAKLRARRLIEQWKAQNQRR